MSCSPKVVAWRTRAAEKERLLDVTLSEGKNGVRFVNATPTYRSVPGLGWLVHAKTHWERDFRLSATTMPGGICRELGATFRIRRRRNKANPRGQDGRGCYRARANDVQRHRRAARAVRRGFDDTQYAQWNRRPGHRRHSATLGKYVTKQTAVAADFVTCPTVWMQFLNAVFGENHEVIDFVRRLLGYLLTQTTGGNRFSLSGTATAPMASPRCSMSYCSSWARTQSRCQARCSWRNGANVTLPISLACAAYAWPSRMR